MVKRLFLLLGSVLLGAVILLVAAGLWLLRTPDGARWVLETGAGAAGAQLSVEQVEGRLADDLELGGVRLQMEGTEASLDRLHLRWLPGRLLRGEFAVMELSLAGGDIRLSPPPPDETQKAPSEFTWPRVSGWPLRLNGVIENLHLENITIHPPEGEGRHLDELKVRVAWDEGVLRMDRLDAAGEGYGLKGDIAVGFVAPLLRIDLRLNLPEAVAEQDALRLTADLEEGNQALLSGPVEVRGSRGGKATLDLDAEIALFEDALRLRFFELTHASRGGMLRGDGEVALSDPFAFSLQIEAEGLDLEQETGLAVEIGGAAEISGTVEDYAGHFNLASRGAQWRQGRLEGRFEGTAERITLGDLDGDWLDGSFGGRAVADWSDGVQVETLLEGRGLDPAVFDSRFSGQVNFDMKAALDMLPGEDLRADVEGDLLDSSLRGRPLTGRVDMSLRGEDLRIAELELHGDGFDLAARGRLRERLEVSADVRRLAGLVPEASGSLQAAGWLRWREGEVSGGLEFGGEGLAFAEARAATLKGQLHSTEGEGFTVGLQAGGAVYEQLRADRLELAFEGTPERHQLSLKTEGPQGEGELLARGGWGGEFWAGTLEQLQGETRRFGDWRLVEPVALELGAERVGVGLMRLTGSGDMALETTADLVGSPLRGTFEGDWRGIELALLGPWLPDAMELQGRSSGEVDVRLPGGQQTAIEGRIEAAGRLTRGDFSAVFSRVEGTVDWNTGGLAARLEAQLEEEGGRFAADLNSEEAPLSIPQHGNLAARWEGIDLSMLTPFFPPDLRLQGELSGRTRGEWLPEQQLSLDGSTEIGNGEVAWQREEGEVSFALRTAKANWRWEGENLQGALDLALADVGRIEGSFSIPLPAAIPASPRPQGALALQLNGEMREQGLLSAIFPGLLRESEGDLTAQLNIGGTWSDPDLNGRLHLRSAGAYFPMAGIEIEDVEVRAELSGDSLRLASFSASSGPGQIEGEGEVRLEQWRPAEYRVTIQGERFQAVDLPELQLLLSPDIRLDGTTEKLKVRGSVQVPELILVEPERSEMVQESPDVVVVGEEEVERDELPIDLDLQVKVVLGDRVLIKYAGVDARLAGQLDLMAVGIDEIAARGEIRVVKGIYSAYGVRLRIERGRILYAGGPVDRPTLDILALRTIGDVKAGVQVSGTPRDPVVNLYSDPTMAETDVLSYIVLGRPMGGDRESAGLLMGAASALLSRGESALMQERLKRQLGVDVLTIEEGGGDVEGSIVTIGKYLSPQLYISYGQSLFTGTNVTKLRYEISESWELESMMGEQSGVDLFYKVEFR